MLKRIIESSQRMMESMSDIVWAIHSKNDSLSGMTDRMTDFAGERLMGLGIEFGLEKDALVDQLHLTMRARRNLLMLFKEGINNAAKYSQSNRIRCSIAASTDAVTMILADDGVGFNTDDVKSGNGLASMKKRAEELKGKFSVNSIPDSGARLTFILPIVQLIN